MNTIYSDTELKLTSLELEERIRKGERFVYIRTEKGGITVVNKVIKG